jgi:hypothetical protein
LTHEYITKWTAHKAVLAMDAKHCVFLLWAKLATLFMEHNLYLEEWLTDKLSLLSLGYLEHLPRKWIKWACHHKENNWQRSLLIVKSMLLSK